MEAPRRKMEECSGTFYAGISATEKLDDDKETKIVAYASASTFEKNMLPVAS